VTEPQESLFDDKFDPPPPGGPTRDDVVTVAAGEWEIDTEGVEPLVGGFRSAVFRTRDTAGRDLVLRAARRPLEAVQVEAEVMSLASEVVPVPRPYGVAAGNRFAVLMMEYMEGVPLDRVLPSVGPGALEHLGHAVADALVALREVQFEKAGFFGPGLTIERPFEHLGRGFWNHMAGCLDSRALRRRLDGHEFESLSRFIEEHEREYAAIDGHNLTHSDFNFKNMLVRRDGDSWQLAALIDWEFGFSGHTLVDVGNVLRFQDELPEAFVSGFVQTLTSGIDLGSDWRRRARLLDLTAIVQFLTRPGRFPRTTQTAREILARTLAEG
jgi:aminoglycoside phosphotransferase (APT) family kinase protein